MFLNCIMITEETFLPDERLRIKTASVKPASELSEFVAFERKANNLSARDASSPSSSRLIPSPP